MDLSFTPEEEELRQKVRRFLDEEVPKSGLKSSSEGREDKGWLAKAKAWQRKLYEAGYIALAWPKEYGGQAMDPVKQSIVNEELVRANAPYLVGGSGLGMFGPTLISWGDEEQKKRFLPKILTAEEIWCQGYSEPGSGSDVASLQTRAVEEGDYFIVNGQKVWTSDAHHADMCILLVRTDPTAPKHKGISYILVDMHSPGVTVRPLVQITGDANFNEVFFEDVKVPKRNLIGEKNQGWQVAITTLMFERAGIGGGRDMLGAVKELRNLAQSVRHNGSTAWDNSDVRQKISQFACEAAAIKYTGFRQITRRLKGLPPGPEGSVLKLTVSELNLRMNKFAMELLGPYSQMDFKAPFAFDKGKWSYRMLASRALTIAGGTSEIQHNIIGERVMGLPKG